MQEIYRKIPVSEHPPKCGWYDTDKGNLFWYESESEWSCRDDRVSSEYPNYWLEAIQLPSEEQARKDFDKIPASLGVDFIDWLTGAKYIIDMITKTNQINMEKSEMLWIASKYADKGYDYEEMCYGDDLYGREKFADEVWEYVEECKEIGRIAFYEKYKDFKLY